MDFILIYSIASELDLWKQKVKQCECDPWFLMTEWHLQTGPRVLSTIIAMVRPPPQPRGIQPARYYQAMNNLLRSDGLCPDQGTLI